MTRDVITVGADSTFMSMQQIFEREAFHHLLVEDNGLLIGVISDRDIMGNITNQLRKNKLRIPQVVTAADVMTKKVITVDSETPIQTASILLLENNISCLPVVDAEYMIEGILSWKDILHYYIYNT
ncbi:CBS domain-containing protein [Reinekea marina]|nr:CBS domain-containing protein [Reinekea forsetii]